MNKQYIFIIWNKALWCKDRKLNDLKESFSINKTLYIKWDKEYYIDNSFNKINEEIANAIANNYDEYINNKESNLFKVLFNKNNIKPIMIEVIDNHNKRDGILK